MKPGRCCRQSFWACCWQPLWSQQRRWQTRPTRTVSRRPSPSRTQQPAMHRQTPVDRQAPCSDSLTYNEPPRRLRLFQEVKISAWKTDLSKAETRPHAWHMSAGPQCPVRPRITFPAQRRFPLNLHPRQPRSAYVHAPAASPPSGDPLVASAVDHGQGQEFVRSPSKARSHVICKTARGSRLASIGN